jgi:hypothetical protein
VALASRESRKRKRGGSYGQLGSLGQHSSHPWGSAKHVTYLVRGPNGNNTSVMDVFEAVDASGSSFYFESSLGHGVF